MIHRLKDFLYKLPSSILISEEQYNNLIDEDGIYIPDFDDDNKEEYISYQLLTSLLDDEKRYRKTLRFMDGNDERLYVGYLKRGRINGLRLRRSDIIHAIEYGMRDGSIERSSKHLAQLQQLKDYIGIDKLEKEYGSCFYSIVIDGVNYRIPVHNIIKLVTLSDEGLKVFCQNPSVSKIQGVPKDKLLFATKVFFHNSDILAEYYFPDEVSDRIYSISNSRYYDIQAMNQLLETRDFPFPEKEINPDLEKEILKDMPEEFTSLQKAIYIYIKMCSLLSYDPEYFAVNQRGPLAEKHKDPNMLDMISPINNKVVCYEFSWIYGKMLDKLGIHFQFISTGKSKQNSSYGNGHSRINFRIGKYLVSADAVVSVLNNDLTNVKTGRDVKGLTSLNQNQSSKDEFDSQVRKIQMLVFEQQKENKDIPSLSFDDIVSEYRNVTRNLREVSIQDRLDIWESKANITGLGEMDYYAYLIQLRKLCFDHEMLKNNFRFVVVRNNSTYQETGHFGLQGIVAKNDYSFDGEPDATEYYYLNNGKLLSVAKEQLEEDMAEGKFEYLQGAKEIPSIHVGGARR